MGSSKKTSKSDKAKGGDSQKKKPSKSLKSLSSLEDDDRAIQELKRMAGNASLIASEAATRVGLPKIYATKKEVVVEVPGKEKEVLVSSYSLGAGKSFFVKYKKGTVLHAGDKK